MEIEGQWCPTLQGELQDREALIAVGAHRAAVVAIATRDQLQNLSAAEHICSLKPDGRSSLITLVDNAAAMRPVAELLMHREQDRARITLLDRFELAALAARSAMEDYELLLQGTRGGIQDQPVVLIVGLGRFGRAVMREVAHRRQGQKGVFVAVDPCISTRRGQLDELVRGTGWQWEPPPGYANEDALVWASSLRDEWPSLKAVFLCVDDDVLNLQLGSILRGWLSQHNASKSVDVSVVLRITKPLGVEATPGRGIMVAEGLVAYTTQEMVHAWLDENMSDQPAQTRDSPGAAGSRHVA